MKKNIILIAFLFLSISSIKAQCGIGYEYDFKKVTDLEKRDLRGKIERVTYSHYGLINSFGKITKGIKNCEQEVLFNKDGSVNKITNLDSKGEIKDVYSHEYENGEIKFINHYNNKGILVSKTAFINEELDIREQTYTSEGRLNDQYLIRSYDLIGNLVKEVWKFHEEPQKIGIDQYYYDKNNRVIKKVRGDDIFVFTYKDNYSKIPVKIERIDPITKKMKIDRSFEFNSFGSIIKEYDIDKLSRSYDYIYDNKNNWIKKVLFDTEAKIPYEIIERKIKYFL
jgi:hypothetical protein